MSKSSHENTRIYCPFGLEAKACLVHVKKFINAYNNQGLTLYRLQNISNHLHNFHGINLDIAGIRTKDRYQLVF